MTGQAKAERLRRARASAGYRTAAAAAAALGVKTPTYCSHENGTRDFGDADAARYSRAFGVAVEWLVFGGRGRRGGASRPQTAWRPHETGGPGQRCLQPYGCFELDVRAGAGSIGADALVENVTRNGVTISQEAVGGRWAVPADYLSGELRIPTGRAFIIEVFW